jgi:hypothetical protein
MLKKKEEKIQFVTTLRGTLGYALPKKTNKQ